MSVNVHDALVDLWTDIHGVEKEEAVGVWKERMKEGSYLRDIWG
jgi:hypothetical protein